MRPMAVATSVSMWPSVQREGSLGRCVFPHSLENTMPSPGTAGVQTAPVRETIDLETLLGDSNAQLVVEGLYRLRELKLEALRAVRAMDLNFNGYRFKPWDFGIPQIDSLLARFGAEPAEDSDDMHEH